MIAFYQNYACLIIEKGIYLFQGSYFHMLICSNGCTSYTNGKVLIPIQAKIGIFFVLFINSFLVIVFVCLICRWKASWVWSLLFWAKGIFFRSDNDIYFWFQSFNGVSKLENSIKEKCPAEIDIGPVYSVDVRFLVPQKQSTICFLAMKDFSMEGVILWLINFYCIFLSH